MECPAQFADADDGPGGVRRLLSGGEDRIRADVSAASGFGPLACELYLGCSAFADAAPHLVVHLAGRISRTLGGAIAEWCSTPDDFVLVHQQLVRSSDQRGPDALSRWRTDSLQEPSRSRHFLSLRSTRRSVFILVFGRGVCDMESLGPGRLLEADPNTISFERPGGINSCAVDRHMGEERNSSPAEISTFELPGGMRSLCYSVLGQLRCSL